MAAWKGLALALVATAGCAAAPPTVVERWRDTTPPPRGPALLRAAMLAGHDPVRVALRLPPLAWDDRLAVDAQLYADRLARSRHFAHSHAPRGAEPEGENLWMGTRDAYRYEEMVGHWVAERRWFVDRPAPDFSSTGNGADVAHYTQIVWRATTRVGCALASNADNDYLVCRYAPPGNVVGQRAF